jgi:hypothetical protein
MIDEVGLDVVGHNAQRGNNPPERKAANNDCGGLL